MKRLTLIILTIAITAGVFMPFTASFSSTTKGIVQTSAYAQTDTGGNPTFNPNEGGTLSDGSTIDNTNGIAPTGIDGGLDVGNTGSAKGGGDIVPAAQQPFELTSEFRCGVIGSNVSMAGCIEWILYFIPFKVGALLMQLSAWAFDSVAALSLSSILYSSSSFIVDGWRITRDFGNIFFILILLFAAISLVLGIEIAHANPKKMIASVIFIAIIVNFSFFITEAIIDTSNVMALVFYNQITVKNSDKAQQTTDNQKNGLVPAKSVSLALVQAFQPQVLQTKAFWDQLRTPGETKNTHGTAGCVTGAITGSVVPVIGTAIGCVAGGLLGYFVLTTTTTTEEVPAPVLIGFLLFTGAMYCVVAYSFLVATLSFLGRMIGLWIAIIFAPFAFVSYIIPSTQHIEGFGWSDWWKSLLTMAFAGPIYFFFLYLITLMTQSSFVSGLLTAGDQKPALLIMTIVFISFLFLIVLLLKATKYVKKASGEIGSMVFKGAAVLGGGALGVAAGMGAGLLSRTAGAYFKSKDTETARDLAAGRVTDSSRAALLKNIKDPGRRGTLQSMSYDELAQSSEFQSLQRNSAKKLARWQRRANNSYDFRENKVVGAALGAAGMNAESFGAFSTKNTAGGYNGAQMRKAAKLRAFTDSLESNHEQLLKLENAANDREDEIAQTEDALKEARLKAKITQLDADKEEEQRLQRKVNELRNGKIYDHKDSNNNVISDKFTDADVGTQLAGSTYIVQKSDVGKTNHRWKMADIGKFKADGEKVSEMDVKSGAIKTEAMGVGAIKKLAERAKTDRAKSFMHQQMVQSGYGVHGQLYDDLGQLKQMGHMDMNGTFGDQSKFAMKAWRKDIGKNIAEGAAAGLSAGFALGIPLGVGALGTAMAGGVLGAMQQAMRQGWELKKVMGPLPDSNMFAKFTDRRMEARAINVAADLSHQIHTATSTYKTAGKGIVDFLKSIGADSGGGHGHDDHGGGHAADHGGGGHH